MLQAPNVTATYYGCETQLSRVYSREVYKEFRERYKSSTAFYVEKHPDKAKYFLVSHAREPTDFPWLQHEYWVKAVVNKEMPEESVFACECMRLVHTGACSCY